MKTALRTGKRTHTDRGASQREKTAPTSLLPTDVLSSFLLNSTNLCNKKRFSIRIEACIQPRYNVPGKRQRIEVAF